MFRIFSLGSVGCLGARLLSEDLQSVDDDLSSILDLKENATMNKDCLRERFWPPALAKKYPHGKMVGSGATACVAIADYPGGGKVALKVGKKGANIQEWSEECEKLKKIRMDSCKNKVLDLHEQYIPTCIEVGSVKYKGESISYYAMHAASIHGISAMGKRDDLTVSQQKSVGAQIVAAIYSFHMAGYAHNDLHGNNIVVDPDTFALALIDLGDAAHYPGWIKDYKRDGNAVWRWLSVMAQCDDNAQWHSHVKGRSNVRAQGDRFLACIEQKWNPGADFMKGLKQVVKGDVMMMRKHFVEQLWDTNFIKSNLPKRKVMYASGITKGCSKWSSDEWRKREYQHEFSNHFKCDTVPTYKSKSSKNKVSVQCQRGRPHKSGGNGHCFTTKKGVNWGCAGAIDWDGFAASNKPCYEMGMPGGGMFSGGCLTPDHPGYFVAKTWS